MARQLYLIRHAQAGNTDLDSRDIDRTLTSDGCQDAMRMGKLLKEEGHMPDMIISSTAERTRETARFFCEQLNYDFDKVLFTEDLYESSVRIMLTTINNSEDIYQNLFLISHNPAISYLAEFLTGEIVGNVPAGGVVHLSTKTDSWQELSQDSCSLVKFYDPIDL